MNILQPKWTLWYLLSLFYWKVLAEISSKIRWIFPISLLLSLYIGLIPEIDFLSISRTIAFFPYFIAGYYCQRETFSRIREWKRILPFTALLVALVIAVIFLKTGINEATLYFKNSYRELGQSDLQGIVIRAALLCTSYLCILGLISIVPSRRTVLSNFGRYSITIYLGHSLVIRGLKYLKIINITNHIVFILFALGFSLAFCFLLGNHRASQLYKKLIEKTASYILIRQNL